MNDELWVICQLNDMINRATAALNFYGTPSRCIFPPPLAWYREMAEFIWECQTFQMDLLRPWDRTD